MTKKEFKMHLFMLGLVHKDNWQQYSLISGKFTINNQDLYKYNNITIRVHKPANQQIYVDIDGYRYMKLCKTYKCVIKFIEDYIYGSTENTR